jgi:pyruvate/2-oxoglutarate dehydrogenase complex dihydrolipoamide dehydrogenase (E3) component
MQDVDVIVVGAGQAAKPLVLRFAGAGKRVVLFEEGHVGGTCINTGCTPTKTMLASARAAHVARTSGRLGVHVPSVEVDLGRIVDRKDALVLAWRSSISKAFAAASGVTVVPHHARFVGERTLEANGIKYSAPIVILDVGARAATPSMRGLDSVPWLDNAAVMALRQLPEHLVVLGGGYIGCEMAQMFRRFGARVTIVHNGQHVLSREDPDVAAAIQSVLVSEGVDLKLRSTASQIAPDGPDRKGVAVRLADGAEVRGSHLLVALGRRANTENLGCEAGGIRLDPKGNVVADEFYATTAAGVYAVGDVLGGPQFTHTSWDDHRRLYERLTNPGAPRRPRSERLIPYCVFTDPQVACVGLSEHTAKARGIPYQVAIMPVSEIARADEVDEMAGIFKVLVDPGADRILGACLVGPEAGELLHVFVSLMQAGASPTAIVDPQYVHPTFAEGVQSLIMKLPRYALS